MTTLTVRLRHQLVIGLALLVGAVAAFWPTLRWMTERFGAADSFYSHGWLMPLATAWLIWQRRETLRFVPWRGSLWGLGVLIPALALHTLAVAWQIGFLGGFMMVAALAGLIWTCCGTAALRTVRGPLAFLLFMVPLPSILLLGTSFHLKLAAAGGATHVLQWMGIPAQLGGSIITVPGLRLIVDDTCSGLRSLISLVALATFWAAVMLPRAARLRSRLLVAASAVPIALAANLIRIVVLVLLGGVFGSHAAQGFMQYGSGLLVFGIALLTLAGIGRLVSR